MGGYGIRKKQSIESLFYSITSGKLACGVGNHAHHILDFEVRRACPMP